MKELQDEIKQCTAGSFLSRLWRKIVLLDGYYKILTPLMNDYIQKLLVKSMSNTKISINRTNIHNKILDDSMTWKNLMFLLSEILVIKELETNIEIINTNDEKLKYNEVGMDGMVLTRLWGKISKDVEDIPDRVNDYYIRKKNNPNKVNKTNLQKKMSDNQDMSWNSLMFLIDEILLAREFTISLKLKNRRGTYTKHSISYKIRS